MFLNTKTLLVTFSIFTLTGCALFENKEQQDKITNLQSSLSISQIKIQETSAELESVNNTLKLSEDKISALTIALEKSREEAKKVVAIKETKPPMQLDDKTILGQSEWVYVSAVKDNFKGRIDTGATTSSINAVDIERFERDGEKWVRFNLTHAQGEKAEMIESKIVRIAKIVQSSKPGVETERPVIQLHVRIGDTANLTEFTLTSRLHMKYPVLIGRTFMKDVVLVDVSKEYIFPKYQAPANK